MWDMISDMGDKGKVLDNLRCQCSRREYCTADVMKKAEKALEGDVEQACEVVRILVEERYVDDLRYASAFARDKSSISGWGGSKIRYMLSAKGIPKDIISQALDEIDMQKAGNRMEKLLENKSRSLKDDPQWKLKLIRFALGRGYSYDDVNDFLKNR